MRLSIIAMIILLSSMAAIGTDYYLLYLVGIFLGVYLLARNRDYLRKKYPNLLRAALG